MGDPRHRVRASGLGGSGYRNPVTGEVTPGVTTVLKHGNADGLIQWAVDQTAAHAVANIDALLNRTEEQGWGYLRYYHKRTQDLESDPLRNAHKGVLNDLADMGTRAHDYWEYAVTGRRGFEPDAICKEDEEMFIVIDDFLFQNDVKPIATELTVWGDGYTGTLDGIIELNGFRTLHDAKTARRVHDSHKKQLSALDKAEVYDLAISGDELLDNIELGDYANIKTLPSGAEWVMVPKPTYEKYGFIHIRPSDTDNEGKYMAPFCRFEEVDPGELKFHYNAFRGLLDVATNERDLKDYRKAKEKENKQL